MTGTAPSAAAERVRELLEAVRAGLGLDAEVRIEERGDELHATLVGEDLGLFIGRHGQTIDAVQHLAYKAAVHGRTEPCRVTVDAAGYRDRRRAVLTRQADEAAGDAARTGAPVALEPMNAGERKLVHEYLKDRPDIETYSEGSEPDRHLVVAPARST
jgi:spoIIIJ-associated protein